MTQVQTVASYGPALHAVASRLVNCRADAEDLVQDTFLKWLSVDKKKIENTKAYLMRVVINNSLNHIKTLKKRQEEYFDGFSLPDIALKVKELDLSYLDVQTNIRNALSVLHSKLEPLERAVYLLREVFDFDYEELQDMLKKKQNHCRQIFSRAKKKLKAETQKVKTCFPDVPRWKDSFDKACHFGFLNELIRDLQKDAHLSIL